MPWFPVIEIFKVFRIFFLKILAFAFPFFKDFIILSVYGVGISPFFTI